MAGSIAISLLAYLHIISAMGWLGGAVFFVSVVGPGLRSLSPMASMEFLTKVGPRAIRFFIGTSTATIVFGLGLFYFLPDGTYISIGLALGLIAWLDALFIAVPSLRKADRLAREAMAGGQAGPPSPELAGALKRGRLGAASVVVLLVITLIFMVAAGFY